MANIIHIERRAGGSRTKSLARGSLCWRRLFASILATVVFASGTPMVSAIAEDSRAEFDIVFEEEHVAPLVVPVTIARNEYRFAVDTGSSISTFDLRLTPLLGDAMRVSRFIMPGGTRNARLYRAPAGFVGDVRLSPFDGVTCVDLGARTAANERKLDGVLGIDAIGRCIVQMDFDRRKLCFLKSVPPQAGVRLPLVGRQPAPTLTATVGALGQRPFVIDTGFNGEVAIAKEEFARLLAQDNLLLADNVFAFSTGGSRALRIGVLEAPLVVGVEAHSNLVVAELPESREPFNILGLDYLSRYIVVLDFLNNAVYLRPSASFRAFRPGGSLLGIRLARDGTKILVHTVGEKSRAARFDVRPGDAVETINGAPVAIMRDAEVVAMLSGNNRDVKLVFRRPTDGSTRWMRVQDLVTRR